MTRILTLAAAAALLAGCNANLGLQIGNVGRSATQPSVGPGGALSSSAVNVRFGDVPGAGSFLGAIGLGWLVGNDPRTDTQRTPPLDESRSINEQDCRGPVLNSANLRCQ